MGKEMKTQMHEMYKKGKFVGVKKKKCMNGGMKN